MTEVTATRPRLGGVLGRALWIALCGILPLVTPLAHFPARAAPVTEP